MRPRLLAALGGALLGGCAAGPNYEAPTVAAPPAFAAPGEFDPGTPLLRWWQVLGDDNLTALIERAIGGANLDLRSADARIRQARAELGVAAAAAVPSVNASAQVSRDRISGNSELLANLPLPNPRTQFTDYRAGFDASWELDLFGHTSRSIEAAGARLQGAQAGLRDVRIAVAGEVARTYIQLRQGEQQIAFGEADLAGLGDSARLVQLRFEAGSASELDLRRARANVETQRSVLDGVRAEKDASLDALAVLVGATPQEAAKLILPGRPVPAVGTERIAVGLPSELLRRRPDVRRAERDLAAATADIGVATANLYPRFQLVGNFGVDAIEPGELGRRASRTWSLAPQVFVPVFGRGRLTSEVAAREAARDATLAGYHKAVLSALSDVEMSMIRFDRARARVASLERAWRDLDGNAALVREQYAAGRSSLLDVLEAERQARQAQEQHTDATATLAVQLVALYKALGGGWDDSDPAADRSSARNESAPRTPVAR